MFRSRSLHWALILLVLAGAVAGHLAWQGYRDRRLAQQVLDHQGRALREIAAAYNRHIDAKGKPPATVNDLAPYVQDPNLMPTLQAGIYHVRYGVPRSPVEAENGRTLLAHVKFLAGGRMPAVMLDGTVQPLTPDEIEAAGK
jgi:hypothetical protein